MQILVRFDLTWTDQSSHLEPSPRCGLEIHDVESGRTDFWVTLLFNSLVVLFVWFIIVYFQKKKMGPHRAILPDQDPIDVPSIHPFYRFSHNISQAMVNNYMN